MAVDKGSAREITVFGVVQGVGFRPFVYRTAVRIGLRGWVRNIGEGVRIHLEFTRPETFFSFVESLRTDLPPLACIEKLTDTETAFTGASDFRILKSAESGGFVFISPDISVCSNCLREMMSPNDRRYRYPFINCTDCGPRYTIVQSLPYDRPRTTMASFPMCPLCSREYNDPLDRRYHAQPIACPDCGPEVTLYDAGTGKSIDGGFEQAVEWIKDGKIVAVKGLGGYHLVCSPRNEAAVLRLRQIKNRNSKALALMAADAAVVQTYAHLSPEEREHLESPRRPIVLLKKRLDLPHIAPFLDEYGIMLPYTPLHVLLLEKLDLIVATSSNRKDAPIIKDKGEDLVPLCDAVLDHNRPIHMRADDSVLKVAAGSPLFLRRARGYVPFPQRVPEELTVEGDILAVGAELKDTISVYKNGYVVTSQFLGDLDEYSNLLYFEETIGHLSRLFQVEPRCVVCDSHPDFHSTRFAFNLDIPVFQVQHHHAHLTAVLLEHGIAPGRSVLGVVFDGYGYGADGTAWGGEFLVGDYETFERFAHFEPVALPGGDLAARQPWRMALSYLMRTFEDSIPSLPVMDRIPARMLRGVREMVRSNVNSPLCSSAGRLFDAVSFLSGLAPPEVEYEAEAPLRLQSAATSDRVLSYPFNLAGDKPPYTLSFRATIAEVVNDVLSGIGAGTISAKFHNTLARTIVTTARRAREELGIDTVALGGGVFCNSLLLENTQSRLEAEGFRCLRPVLYSPNDEAISVGQIAHALARIKKTDF
ncbi:MAG: carbamoyltransferase HypF [Acidobacteria bacterium]|nr:carbamoyltransferase HypF [Acidobacteriota bacterium]